MDRGRVGTLAIGNKSIRDGMVKHQQDVHLERINKIKNRKPGTSNTLDNTAPVIVKAALHNPRKIALKLEFNEVMERENRVLLQKISAILTAPPKITDEDYVRMRKIVQNLKGGKARYEEEVQMKHHRIYLKHLKTMGPYYKPKDWELDYRRQLRQQKFMRQVTYVPPKCAASQLPLTELASGISKPRASSANDAVRPSGGEGSRSSAHVHRIREVKNDSKAPGRANAGGNKAEKSHQHQHQQAHQAMGETEYEYDFDNENEPQEQMEELAHVERLIRVTSTSIFTNELDDEIEKAILNDCMGHVNCWLVDKSILVISTKSSGSGDIAAFDAEAEIDVLGLAEIQGIEEKRILSDSAQLASLAKYIAESVEVRIESGEARVILNLAGEYMQDMAANNISDGNNPKDGGDNEDSSILFVVPGEGESADGPAEYVPDSRAAGPSQDDVESALIGMSSVFTHVPLQLLSTTF